MEIFLESPAGHFLYQQAKQDIADIGIVKTRTGPAYRLLLAPGKVQQCFRGPKGIRMTDDFLK